MENETKIKKKASSIKKLAEEPKKVSEKKTGHSEKPLKNHPQSDGKLIAIIRIKGEVKVKEDVVETLYRLRLRKKYTCILINSNNKGLMGMLDKIKHNVAFGEIDDKTLEELIKLRGKKIASSVSKKTEDSRNAAKAEVSDFKKVAKELMDGKSLTELGFKGFFRLHPPRKGINSKLIYPKGVLGNHGKEINKLIERML